jgi:hypothetical protein
MREKNHAIDPGNAAIAVLDGRATAVPKTRRSGGNASPD